MVKSNLGEERIHLSVHFHRAVHHCGKSRQGLKAGTEAETKTLLARALSGPCSATFLTQSRLTCIEKVLLKSGCLLHQSSINLLSYCCNRTQGPKQHKKSHCLFYGVLLLRGSETSLRSSQQMPVVHCPIHVSAKVCLDVTPCPLGVGKSPLAQQLKGQTSNVLPGN